VAWTPEQVCEQFAPQVPAGHWSQLAPTHGDVQEEQVPSPVSPSLQVPCTHVQATHVPPKYPAPHDAQLVPDHPVLHIEQVPSPVVPLLHVPLRHVHAWQFEPK